MGLPEIVMIVVALGVLAIPVGIAIGLIWYFSSRSNTPKPPPDSENR